MVAVRGDQRPGFGRQTAVHAIGHAPGKHQRGGAWPEPPGHPAANLRDARHPVGDFFGTLQKQGQRAGRLRSSQRSHSRHAPGVERGSRQTVNRLGGEPHNPALCQASDRAMDDIANVVGLRHVDPLRCSGRVSHRTVLILGLAPGRRRQFTRSPLRGLSVGQHRGFALSLSAD